MHLTSLDSSTRTLLMPSCLSVGCCEKKATAQAAQAADLCLSVQESGKTGSRCWQIPAEEGPLLCVQMTAFSSCPHVAEKRSKLSPLSSRKDTNPISGTLLSPTLCSHAGQLPGSGRLCVCSFSFLRLKEPPNFLYHIRRSALTRKPPQPIPVSHLGALGTLCWLPCAEHHEVWFGAHSPHAVSSALCLPS